MKSTADSYAPPALLVSSIYALLVRGRVTDAALRAHMDWRLTTCVVTAGIGVLSLALLFIGSSGVGTDAPISIAATFVLVGLLAVAPLRLLYRIVRGSLRCRRKLPMESLFL